MFFSSSEYSYSSIFIVTVLLLEYNSIAITPSLTILKSLGCDYATPGINYFHTQAFLIRSPRYTVY